MSLRISSIFSSSFLVLLSYTNDFSSAKDIKEYFKMLLFSKTLQHVPTFEEMDGSLEVFWTYVLKYLSDFHLSAIKRSILCASVALFSTCLILSQAKFTLIPKTKHVLREPRGISYWCYTYITATKLSPHVWKHYNEVLMHWGKTATFFLPSHTPQQVFSEWLGEKKHSTHQNLNHYQQWVLIMLL